MSLRINLNLTDPDGSKAQAIKTHPGMAHFAGSGPAWKACKACRHFKKNDGSSTKGTCREWKRMMPKQKAIAFPQDAAACKYFQAEAA